MTIYLENRAYGCIGAREALERKMERARSKSRGQSFSKKLAIARKEESVQLIDDLRLLSQWMREDVLSLTGPTASARRELFDFIVAEMKISEHLAPHRIRPVRTWIEYEEGCAGGAEFEVDRDFADEDKRCED